MAVGSREARETRTGVENREFGRLVVLRHLVGGGEPPGFAFRWIVCRGSVENDVILEGRYRF